MNIQILNHVKKCEGEACGLIINNEFFYPCRNIAKDKRNNFEISPDDWIKVENKGQVTAIVHSHSKDYPFLSEADLYFREQSKLDWWLVCDGRIDKYRYFEPLIGREFKHGITDCYSLFRDAYHLCGIELFNFERSDEWWKTQNLYLDNMSNQGFYQVSEAKRGDIILISLGAKVPNHAAIYVGEQQILHHCPKRLSKRDLYDGYWLKYTHSIWRHKQWQSSSFTAISNAMVCNSR